VVGRAEVSVSGRSLSRIPGSNPAGEWVFFYCECCAVSDLCDRPITRPEESSECACVIACDQVQQNPLRLERLGRSGED
jgi:hypothetical protein